jgi:IS30 family transposase
LIAARPAVVTERSRVGDWEGDPIVGQSRQSAIGTLLDRRSGFVRLVHLPDGHNAQRCRLSIEQAIPNLPTQVRLKDQGSEMAQHDLLAAHFIEGVYFAYPASPWRRPTNENTNGLLRRYVRKKTNLRIFTPHDLAEVEHRLNHRPRKRHSWRTPADIFTAALTP